MERLPASRPVFKFSTGENGAAVVGKFFSGHPPAGTADRALLREFSNYRHASRWGLTNGAGWVPHLKGRHPDLRLGLLLTAVPGPDLDFWLKEACSSGNPAGLFPRLELLAGLLAHFHTRPLKPRPPASQPVFWYWRKVQGQLARQGLLNGFRERRWDEEFQAWSAFFPNFPDRQVLIHGDATPTNFLCPHGRVVALDLEKLRLDDRLWDLSLVAAELKHAWGWRTGDFLGSEAGYPPFLPGLPEGRGGLPRVGGAPLPPQPPLHGPGGVAHRPQRLPVLALPPGVGGRGLALSCLGWEVFMKTVLIIAGSDPGAGAGLQQDLKVATLLGTYGLTVVTALTVQNSQGVRAVHPVAAGGGGGPTGRRSRRFSGGRRQDRHAGHPGGGADGGPSAQGAETPAFGAGPGAGRRPRPAPPGRSRGGGP